MYTDGSATDKVFPIPKNTVIGPEQTLVFWYNSQSKTPAEFNAFFGTSIPEEQIISYKICSRASPIVEIEELQSK